jgi:hypothetical protein
VLPFGRLWYAEPSAIGNAIRCAKFFSRLHDAMIRIYDDAGNVIETHEHTGDFLWRSCSPSFHESWGRCLRLAMKWRPWRTKSPALPQATDEAARLTLNTHRSALCLPISCVRVGSL